MTWDKRGGGGSAASAALLGVGYAGALAQWACLRSGDVLSGEDRSGNAYHMGDVNPMCLPDLIPGKAAMCPKGNGDPVAPTTLSRAAVPALQLAGALTVCARVALMGYNFAGSAGFVAGVGNFTDASEAGNQLWALCTEQNALNASRIFYYAQAGAGKVAQFAYSNVVTLNNGLFHFVCIRRDAAGTVVDVQVDTDSKQTTGLTKPTGGTTGYPRLGGNSLGTPTQLVNGLQADVNVFGSRLTDAQVEIARRTMMGA